jgi:hypothetical protein
VRRLQEVGRGKGAGREAGREEGRGGWRSAKRINDDLSSLLSGFAEEIAGVRVLDSACGSGNFLSDSMQNLLNSWRLPAPTINFSACCTRGCMSYGR